MRVSHDIHVHTRLSACCQDKEHATAANCVAVAEEMGLEAVGFADHIWVNPDLEPSAWYRPQDESHIRLLREELRGVASPVRVLVGCEAETVAPGQFGITKAFAETLDFVLLSCSHFHMKGFVASPADDTPSGVARHLIDFFLSGVRSGLPPSIAHPFLPIGYLNRYDEIIAAFGDQELLDAFAVAAARKVAVEITASYCPPRSDGSTWSLETPLRLLELAQRAGCEFTLGSDAHSPAEMRKIEGVEYFLSRLEPVRIVKCWRCD